MGIGLSNTNWLTAIQANKAEDKKRAKKNLPLRFPEPEKFKDTSNIRTTPTAEAFIKAHCTKLDDNDKAVVSTERGRRRRARLNNQ
jgi:hypothetical protein